MKDESLDMKQRHERAMAVMAEACSVMTDEYLLRVQRRSEMKTRNDKRSFDTLVVGLFLWLVLMYAFVRASPQGRA
jgi:hypothetical protein